MNGILIFQKPGVRCHPHHEQRTGRTVVLRKGCMQCIGLMNTKGGSNAWKMMYFQSTPSLDNLGRTQQATFVNEDGLYDAILECRKSQAKCFRKWVTS